MTIKSGGNVGIGTTSPDKLMTVHYAAPAYNTVDDVLRLVSKFTSTGNAASALAGSGPAIVFAGGIGDNQTRDRARIVAVYEGSNVSGLAFHTQNTADIITEKMRIQNNGKVGIGQPVPTSQLEVKAANGATGIRLTSPSGLGSALNITGSGYGEFYLYQAGGNPKVGLQGNGTSYFLGGGITVGHSAEAGISANPADLNYAEVGPGFIRVNRDDTADAAQLSFGKNGATHSYLETRTNGLGFVTNVGDFAFEGGKVGIGHSSPDSKLDVVSGGGRNSGGTARFGKRADAGLFLHSDATTSHYNWMITTQDTVHKGFEIIPSTAAGNIEFTYPAFVILADTGNIGIGTNIPAGRLHVDGATSSIPALTLESNSSGDVIPLHFKARANDGTFTYHGIWANPGTANTDNTINLGQGANSGIIVNNDGNVSIPSYQGITRSKSTRYHWTSPVTAIYTGGTRKTQVFRLYYCPNHWVSTPIDLDVELRSKYYENFSASFSIAQGYGQSEPQVFLKHQAFNQFNVRLEQGASTSAGYNYSGQPVYYTDFYIWCNTYMTAWVEVTATSSFYSSNITSGWGGVTVNNSNGTSTTGDTPPALFAPNVNMFSGHTFTAKEIQASRGDAGILITANSASGNGSGITNFFSSLLSSSNNANCDHFKGTTQSVNSYKLLGNGSSTWSSDINLKRDISTTRDGYLADVNALRVVKYKWKNDPTSGVELGLIAQEVESIFPSLVTNDVNSVGDEIAHQDQVLYLPDDLDIPEGKSAGDIRTEEVAFQEGTTYKGVKYSVLPVITLKALQELSDKVDLLVSENAALKTRIETLEG
jgi:hypothetical protein